MANSTVESAIHTRILIIGATGYLGRHIVAASVRLSHPTFALVRDPAAAGGDPARAELISSFKSLGVSILQGDLNDYASLVAAIRQVDVVISSVSIYQTMDQLNIIAAIKEVGHIKRFIPSEFVVDVDRNTFLEPAKSMFERMAKIRRAMEADRIPFTIVLSYIHFAYALPYCAQVTVATLPRGNGDKVHILGDGKTNLSFVHEDDISTYSVLAVDDPRTLNKILHIKPPANILSHNDYVALWERTTGMFFERVFIPEEELLKELRECSDEGRKINLATARVIFFCEGDVRSYMMKPSFDVEATELYPDVKYATVEEHMRYLL